MVAGLWASAVALLMTIEAMTNGRGFTRAVPLSRPEDAVTQLSGALADTRRHPSRRLPCLLRHEAVSLHRDAAIRAQCAVRAEEELAIRLVVHQVHPEPGGEREEVGALA